MQCGHLPSVLIEGFLIHLVEFHYLSHTSINLIYLCVGVCVFFFFEGGGGVDVEQVIEFFR